MSALAFLFLLVAVDLIPLLFASHRIVARGRAAGTLPGWHCMACVFGGLIVAMVMSGVTVQYFLSGEGPRPSRRWQAVAIVASGLGGSTFVAAAVYLHLRMALKRDPDYEPLEGPPEG